MGERLCNGEYTAHGVLHQLKQIIAIKTKTIKLTPGFSDLLL
jgi:hypothetical protein